MTLADIAKRSTPARTGTRSGVLSRSLAIAEARTLPDLVSRVLEAAVDLTGAAAGAAVSDDGTCWTAGDPELARALAHDPDPLAEEPGVVVLTDAFDTVTIALVTDRAWRLRPDAGAVLALIVAHGQAAAERLREIELLAERADSDPLTGLRHQRPFEARLSTSQPGRTAVIAFDVDDFKKINDVYGHPAGDDALRALVAALRSALRGDDQLYRIGGDEFAVVVEVNGVAETRTITRRLLKAARAVGHTVSVGAAIQVPGETGRETLVRADRALYEAKRAGRDTARIAA